MALTTVSCDKGPTEPLKEWSPADHNHQAKADGKSEAKPKATTTSPAASAKGSDPTSPKVDEVVLATWRSKCVSCHGSTGMGDGPQAVLFKPANLRSASWQAEADDARILASIQQGRGKMPGFALPEETAKGLLALVRSFGPARSKGTPAPSTPTKGADTAAGSANQQP